MADPTDKLLDRAEERGKALLEQGLRASAARFDKASGRVMLDLANGCSYAFPAQLVQDLDGADRQALEAIEIDGFGLNLHWPLLDVDLFVPALVAGIFGTRKWMTSELARAGGRTTTPAKAAAARSNGLKGGRPRKAARG